MEPTITADIVVAYAQCPRKAYLLLFSPDKGGCDRAIPRVKDL